MKRLVAPFLIGIQFCLLFWLATATSLAEGDCPLVHTVQPNENLTRIAQQYDVSVDALVKANAIANRNLIRTGQRFCIPQSPDNPQAEAIVSGQSRLEIVTEFRLAEETAGVLPLWKDWLITRDHPLGVHYAFPLASSIPATDTVFRKGDKLLEYSATRDPALWLIRNQNAEPDVLPTYTLVVIGDPLPLLSLQISISPTTVISDLLPISGVSGGCRHDSRPVAVLGRGFAADVQMQAEVIVPNQMSLHFPITDVEYWETPDRLRNCESAELALHPIADSDAYDLLLVLQPGPGAPGGGDAQEILCEVWEDGNWVEKVMWYLKCPGE